jgi:hypothetical protein
MGFVHNSKSFRSAAEQNAVLLVAQLNKIQCFWSRFQNFVCTAEQNKCFVAIQNFAVLLVANPEPFSARLNKKQCSWSHFQNFLCAAKQCCSQFQSFPRATEQNTVLLFAIPKISLVAEQNAVLLVAIQIFSRQNEMQSIELFLLASSKTFSLCGRTK